MAKRKTTAAVREELRDETGLLMKLSDQLHEYGLHLPTRTIYLGAEEEVDREMAARFIKNLHVLDSVSDEPVVVLMNNPGGDIYHGLAVCDAIQQSPCEVRAVVRGHAMSMGSIILQHCDVRVMGPLSKQMIHYGSMGADTHAKTFLKWAQEAEQLDAEMEQVYLRRIREKKPDFTLEELQKLLDHDSFFGAERSVEFGLADEVG